MSQADSLGLVPQVELTADHQVLVGPLAVGVLGELDLARAEGDLVGTGRVAESGVLETETVEACNILVGCLVSVVHRGDSCS